MEKRIAVLRGDGIGPEVVNESIKVLERVAQKFGHTFHYYDIIGGVAGLEAYVPATASCSARWVIPANTPSPAPTAPKNTQAVRRPQ